MEKILRVLSGKKGVIASVIMTIVAYLTSTEIIGANEAILVGSLCTIFFGSASYATAKYIHKK